MKLFSLAVVVFLVAHGCTSADEAVEKRGLISDLLTGGNKGTAETYISCCSSMPLIDGLVYEANQLRLSVQGCQARLQQVVDKLTGTRQTRSLLGWLTKPLEVVTDVVKLPFQIAGQVVAVPFNIAKGLANIAEPIIGSKLTNVIKFPIDFAQRVAQAPFQFGAAVIQLPYGIVSEISGWSFRSQAEREKAKLCCSTISGLNDFYIYVRQLREAASICEAKLVEFEVIVTELLNKPECPAGFAYSETTKRCYAVFGNPTTYDEGQQLCGSVGGVLASIRSQDEQTLIENVVKSIPDSSACTCNRGGSCFTTSGQTLNPNQCGSGDGRQVWKPQSGYYMEIGYTNWKYGEPNCYGNNEHCIVLDSFFNYQWNDYSCTWRTCPICEATPKPKRS
jgi:hypothetical protein